MNTKKWTCKDGTKIRIRDMTTRHIINTIKLLERRSAQLKAYTPYPSFQGEMAQWEAENQWEAMQEAGPEYFHPIYTDLKEELKKRKSI